MTYLKVYNACRHILRRMVLMMLIVGCPAYIHAAAQYEGIDRGIHAKVIEPSLPDEELRSAEKFWDEVDRTILIGNIQAFGSYSKLDGDDLWGGSFYGLIAPAVKLTDRMMFIFMYDGQYDRRMDLYSDDYADLFSSNKRTEFQRHAFTPMLRMDFGEDARYSITPSLNYTATWNKDLGDDDGWSQGLYNYRDEGIGLDFDMRQCLGEYGALVIGLQYYKRRYPNFDRVLLDTPDGGLASTNDDKDYHGFIPRIEYRWIRDAGFSYTAAYSLLYKDYDDKKLINSLGYATGKNQEDYVHELDSDVWYRFEGIGAGLKLGLSLGIRVYDSDQNDFRYTNFPLSEVNPKYLNYTSYMIGPSMEYAFELIPLTATCSYSYEYVDYSDRWTRNASGVSDKSDEQWERYHQVVIGLRFIVSEKISLLAQWEYLNSSSNNDFESVYVYDYDMNTFLVGARYDF